MSQVQARPLTSLPRRALRVVLFGMPDAGKSSLLGALAQAAETQPHGLKARLLDPTHGLDQLRHHLYEGQPTRTSEEVVPYPVTLEPFAAEASASAPPAVEVVLVDCDGQVANEFLSRQRGLGAGTGNGALAAAVLQADTLVLVVDASASSDVVKRDFAQFARFLRALEQSRSQRTEVGGLPVYLVLTKCDLLARKGDTLISWMERIEEHKRVVDRKFQEYLAQHAGRESHPFGKIELHLWATAVKHPALENAPARPRDPYGVAELFRQCLQSAEAYRGLQAHAGRRLRWTVAGLAGLVGLLLVLALFFYVTRPSTEAGALESKIRVFRSAQGEAPAERFREPLEDKIKTLQGFEKDPAFAQVPAEQRQFVEDYLRELRAYQEYHRELVLLTPNLGRIRNKNKAELRRLAEAVERLPLPQKYAAAWRDTEVGRRRALWQQDAEVLRGEVDKAEKALTGLKERWEQLRVAKLADEERQARAKELLRDADVQLRPYREENQDHFLPGSPDLTYDNVLQFDPVAGLYREWKKELEKAVRKRAEL
jgi:hypothetical protein